MTFPGDWTIMTDGIGTTTNAAYRGIIGSASDDPAYAPAVLVFPGAFGANGPAAGTGGFIIKSSAAANFTMRRAASAELGFTDGRMRWLTHYHDIGGGSQNFREGFCFMLNQADPAASGSTGYWVGFHEEGGAFGLHITRLTNGFASVGVLLFTDVNRVLTLDTSTAVECEWRASGGQTRIVTRINLNSSSFSGMTQVADITDATHTTTVGEAFGYRAASVLANTFQWDSMRLDRAVNI